MFPCSPNQILAQKLVLGGVVHAKTRSCKFHFVSRCFLLGDFLFYFVLKNTENAILNPMMHNTCEICQLVCAHNIFLPNTHRLMLCFKLPSNSTCIVEQNAKGGFKNISKLFFSNIILVYFSVCTICGCSTI